MKKRPHEEKLRLKKANLVNSIFDLDFSLLVFPLQEFSEAEVLPGGRRLLLGVGPSLARDELDAVLLFVELRLRLAQNFGSPLFGLFLKHSSLLFASESYRCKIFEDLNRGFKKKILMQKFLA